MPNTFLAFAQSPAALRGYLGLSGALRSGVLPARLREQLALTVSELNGCGYCLSAHSFFGEKTGLSNEEIERARHATATDPKADAALKLARNVALEHGHIDDADLEVARAAGLTDQEIIEIVASVALSFLTNFVNSVAEPVIDFPEVKPGEFATEPALA